MQASGNISMGIEWERGRTGKATAGELPPANKATCLGVLTFAKGDTTSTFHICRYGIASKHLKCPISKSNSLFSATTRTASLMRTTLRTTTQTGTGEGARLPPVGVPVPIWTLTTRTPHSPRLSSLGTIIPSVSD